MVVKIVHVLVGCVLGIILGKYVFSKHIFAARGTKGGKAPQSQG